MRLSTLRVILGWIFIAGHFSTFTILFLWALFWSSRGFEAIADIVPLLMPITGVTALAAFKGFWNHASAGRRRVPSNTAVVTILLPTLLTILIICLVLSYVMQTASSPTSVKIGIGLCELVFGGIVSFTSEKLFGPPEPTRSTRPVAESA